MGSDKPTNEEIVARSVELCEEVGVPVATTTDAERILGLPR